MHPNPRRLLPPIPPATLRTASQGTENTLSARRSGFGLHRRRYLNTAVDGSVPPCGPWFRPSLHRRRSTAAAAAVVVVVVVVGMGTVHQWLHHHGRLQSSSTINHSRKSDAIVISIHHGSHPRTRASAERRQQRRGTRAASHTRLLHPSQDRELVLWLGGNPGSTHKHPPMLEASMPVRFNCNCPFLLRPLLHLLLLLLFVCLFVCLFR